MRGDWDRRVAEMNGHAVPILLGMLVARSDRIEERLDGLDRRMEAAEKRPPAAPLLTSQHTWKLGAAAALVAGHRSLTGEWPALSLVAAWLGLG